MAETQSLAQPLPAAPVVRSGLALAVGARLGRYQLLELLGSGGMAHVWVARQSGDLGFSRLVAVKTIRAEMAESASARRMFLDEARLAAQIRHANVVEVVDLGEESGTVYQVMPLIEGDSIAGLCRRMQEKGTPRLPAGIVVRILCDALAGLAAAHDTRDEDGAPLRLVHRDVSPQNILVGRDGLAKIADFGIAKAFGRFAEETDGGQVKGKYSYMSPEQVERREIDRRSDVFAAGIVLWELLTGTRLFQGVDTLDTITRRLAGAIADPRDIDARIDAGLAAVAMRALAREPEGRFAGAAEMAAALAAAGREAGHAAGAPEVAALVESLAGVDIARRRDAVRAGIGSTRSTRTEAATARLRGPPHRGLVVVALVVLAALGLGAGAWRWFIQTSPARDLPARTPARDLAARTPAPPTVLPTTAVEPAPVFTQPQPAPSPKKENKKEKSDGTPKKLRRPRPIFDNPYRP